jgi:2-polyprenyl-3-methyl-5-hydroxy-6-metoxy-1,4-benzoquinol methylase
VDVVERLTLEGAKEHSLLAVSHIHRYDLAAELCTGLRVADVCCGSGYGSKILAGTASSVLGIDIDVGTIATAQRSLTNTSDLEFEAADAQDFLAQELGERFDALVLFEGLEHLDEPERALEALRSHAALGMRIVLSVPNSKTLREDNPHHVTDYGYEDARAACAWFEDCIVLYQFLAEGSLIRGEDEGEVSGRIVATERGEPEYANHFILCVNFAETLAEHPHWATAKMHVEAAPAYNRHVLNLERANAELRRVNARLGRSRLGVSESAAASLVAKLERAEQELEATKKLLREKEQEADLHTWVDHLHELIYEQRREVEAMQSTRVWRLAGSYWALRDRVLRRVSREP